MEANAVGVTVDPRTSIIRTLDYPGHQNNVIHGNIAVH